MGWQDKYIRSIEAPLREEIAHLRSELKEATDIAIETARRYGATVHPRVAAIKARAALGE